MSSVPVHGRPLRVSWCTSSIQQLYAPIRPVMTQPIVGVIWKRWVMVSGSSSLSWGSELAQLMCSSGRRARCKIVSTHGDFALGDDHRGVLASHGDSGDTSSSDGLEGIL